MSASHRFHTDLPRTGRESAVFVLIVSLLSVATIPVLITGLTAGFSWAMWNDVLRVLPVLWVAVVATVLLTRRPADALAARFTRPGDSFPARIIVTTLCTVLCMSVVLTVVGTWIGTWRLSLDPVREFLLWWPRNFAVALAVEMLVAQPVARRVLRWHHRRADG